MKLIATQISRIHPPTIAIPTGVGDMGSKTASAKRESKPSNQDSARIVADGPTSGAHDWLLNNSIEISFNGRRWNPPPRHPSTLFFAS